MCHRGEELTAAVRLGLGEEGLWDFGGEERGEGNFRRGFLREHHAPAEVPMGRLMGMSSHLGVEASSCGTCGRWRPNCGATKVFGERSKF